MAAQPAIKAPTANEQNQLIALYQAGRHAELEKQANQLLQRYPDSGFGWRILSAALAMQGKDSFHALQRTAELLPQDAKIHNNLGDLYAKQDKLKEAESCFRKATQINPAYEDAQLNLGIVLAQFGKLSEAEKCFRQTLAINPNCAEAHFHLALKRKLKQRDDIDFRTLVATEQQIQNKTLSLSKRDEFMLNFALGKSYDDIGDADLAFRHFAEGARLKRETLQYSALSETQTTSELIHILDAGRLAHLRASGNTSKVPIFVVGMPRSGTTLTEQIIASHPEVHGAGELPDLFNITQRNIAGISYPGNMRLLDQSRISAWANEYLVSIQQHNPAARHITDKLPANFMMLGLIHVMFPNAKVIHVKRNPVDTCWSCFTTLFINDLVPWSYDQAELGNYYVNYARIMEHWRQVLPNDAFLEVHYEDLVQDREAQARRLIEYCELDWNEACLESHKHERSVKTASMLQVRKPIYTSSIQRWRNYEKHLGPLLDVLGDLVPNR